MRSRTVWATSGEGIATNADCPIRLLIVDDEPLLRRVLCRVLRHWQVTEAESAWEAIGLLEEGGSFDLILCDLGMSDGTGMDLDAYIRSTRPDLASRMVFMTGGAFTEPMRRFMRSHKGPILRKPLDPDLLFETLSRIATGGP